MRQTVLLLIFSLILSSPAWAEKSLPAAEPISLEPENLFAKHFFMTPDQRLLHETVEVRGFVFVETPVAEKNTRYSIVTDFGGNAIKTQIVPGLQDFSGIRKWIDDNLETASFEAVEIRKLKIRIDDQSEKTIYWIGNKGFPSANEARAGVALIQAYVETTGGDFTKMVKDVQSAFYQVPEPVEEPVEVKTRAQQEKEEELFLKYLDAMDVGEKLWGPFQGVQTGEPITWQSFADISWRNTNLESKNFGEGVGFWSNKLLFKGLRAPLNTVDPFVAVTNSLDTSGVDFRSNMIMIAGLEWRPFQRMAFTENFRPYGIPLLKWMQGYAAALEYQTRLNLKDTIENSDNHDLLAGVRIFYEFGIDLPSLDKAPPSNIPEFLEEYVWGEYFGQYFYDMTGFSTEDDVDDWILNSSIKLGFKIPGIPMPPNPLTDEVVLMPYMIFEHVNSSKFSNAFQNRYFAGTGIRWMPFRDYRWSHNEWVSKTKIFFEYVGIGKTQHTKQDDVSNDIRSDFRFGINLSSNRF